MSDEAWRRRNEGQDDDFGPPLFGDEPTNQHEATGRLSFDAGDAGQLPPWTDPPTGQVPTTLGGGTAPDHTDDLDVWSSFSGTAPVWSDDPERVDEFDAPARTTGQVERTPGDIYADDLDEGAGEPRRGPGRITIGKSTITDAHPHGVLTVNEVIQKSIAPNLDFIPSGHAPGFTLGLLHLNRLKDLIATLRGRYDKIVFASPPIIGVSDASVLASAVDGTVLLIQHRRNPQSMVVRAQQIVESLKAPLLGVVLNQVPLNSGDDYGYYTNNYSYYSEGSGKRRRSSAKAKSPGRGGDELKLS